MATSQQPAAPAQAHEQPKWTDIKHLPEWDEEFYQVYSARKLGKWVMLKALRPQYKDDPFGREMIEREFDVRYNLSHPSIVMINDYEEVPGVGRAIITDDVYGTSLATLIKEQRVTDEHIDKLTHELVEALAYIQSNHIVHHPLRPERIIFTKDVGNLKLIDVGYDQRESLTPAAANVDIIAFGNILDRALDACASVHPHLRKVAARCQDPNRKYYGDISSLRLELSGRKPTGVYTFIICFLAAMVALLVILTLVN